MVETKVIFIYYISYLSSNSDHEVICFLLNQIVVVFKMAMMLFSEICATNT